MRCIEPLSSAGRSSASKWLMHIARQVTHCALSVSQDLVWPFVSRQTPSQNSSLKGTFSNVSQMFVMPSIPEFSSSARFLSKLGSVQPSVWPFVHST